MGNQSPPAKFDNFTIPSNIISLDQFFEEVPASDWDFSKYGDWYRATKKTTSFATILKKYKDQLLQITKCKKLPRDIRSYVDRLLADPKDTDESDKSTGLRGTPANNVSSGSVVNFLGIANTVIVNQQAQQQREDERGSSSVVTTAGSFTSASTSAGKRSEDDREPDRQDSDNDNDNDRGHGKRRQLHPAPTLRSLYDFAFAMYQGNPVSVEHRNLPRDHDTSLLSSIYNFCLAKLLAFNQLDKVGRPSLNVFLSGTVNTMDISNWADIENCFSTDIAKRIINDNKLLGFNEYQNESLKKLMADAQDIHSKHGINELQKFVLKSRLSVLESQMDDRTSQKMIMLEILDHIIGMVRHNRWNDETEAGYMDYWKPIFKILFRHTDVNMKSGETACLASKFDRQMNEHTHGRTSKSVMGRKIDLIFYYDVDGQHHELLSAEFKPANVSDQVILLQQSKNVCLNKSILTKLVKGTNDDTLKVLGVDIVGLNGYVYAFNKYEDIVVASKATGDMFLPRDEAEMGTFLETDSLFPVLFNFKAHVLDLMEQITTAQRNMERQRRIRRDIAAATTQPPLSPVSMPPTFFTPKSSIQ